MNSERLKNEKAFHDDRFGGDDNARKGARKFYSIDRKSKDTYAEIVAQHCSGKRLLEYGCGPGSCSEQWLSQGADLTGIDISDEGIKKAREKISNTDWKASYFVMDAENTDFDDNSFDIVVGTGIIHHLDLHNSYRELSRIVDKDGHIVFLEPLAHNPLINLYRFLTPKMRTEDEHPLREKDIKLLSEYFDDVEARYFSLFALLAVPFRNTSFFDRVCTFLAGVDEMIFLVPFFRKYAWTAVIHASNPKD